MQNHMKMTGQDWFALVLLSLLWGASFLFGKIALAELTPITLVALRVGGAAIVLAMILILRGISLSNLARRWREFLILGFLNNALPFSLIFAGQRHLSAGLAAILNATTPIFTVLVLHIATRDERLTPLKMLGVALGLAGVVVLVGPQALAGINDSLTAELLCLGAALSYAFALLFGRRFRGTEPLGIAAGQLCASTLLIAPAALLLDSPPHLASLSVATMGAAFFLAVFSTAFAYILYFRILLRAGATNAALVTFLVPVSAIFLGAMVLGEQLALSHFAGLAVILLGLAAIDGRFFGQRPPAPSRQN